MPSRQPETIELTAFEAAALDPDTSIRIKGGRTVYEQCIQVGKNETIRLTRLQPMPNMKVRQINRYVDPDTIVILEINDSLRQRLVDVGYLYEDPDSQYLPDEE